MCSGYRRILVICKILNGMTSRILLVLGVYLCEQIKAPDSSSTTTATAVAACTEAASFVILIAEEALLEKCKKTKDINAGNNKEGNCKSILKLVRLVLDLTGVAIACYTSGSSSSSLNGSHAPVVFLILPGTYAIGCDNLGWAGIKNGTDWMTAFSGILMLVLAAIEIVLIVTVKLRFENVMEPIKDLLKAYDSNLGVKHVWDFVHKKLVCCGVNGPQDWHKVGVTPVPESCGTRESIEGCLSMMQRFFDENSFVIALSFVVAGLTQVSDGLISFFYACFCKG